MAAKWNKKERYREYIRRWSTVKDKMEPLRSLGKEVLSEGKQKKLASTLCSIELLFCPEQENPEEHFGANFHNWFNDVLTEELLELQPAE